MYDHVDEINKQLEPQASIQNFKLTYNLDTSDNYDNLATEHKIRRYEL